MSNANTAVLIYNGFEFGASGASAPSYTVRGEPAYDAAGRAVTHVRYTLRVVSLLHADSEAAASALLADARARLSRPGGALTLRDIGWGPGDVRPRGDRPDLLWGALPRELNFEPIGGALAWQLQWTCEFNVGEGAVRPRAGDWLAFNHQTTYSVDDQGFTTRVVRGQVHVAQTRGAAQEVPQTLAERAREGLAIVTPPGFRRVKSDWTEAADKRALTFEVVDEELRGDPFPPGIVAGQVDFTLESTGPAFTHSRGALRGWFETAPDRPKSWAAVKLLEIARHKMLRLQAAGGGLAAPERVLLRHELFTRRTHVEVELRLVQRLPTLLAAAGVWAPAPGADYRRWRASLERFWTNRGRAELRPDPADAVIIDLGEQAVRAARVEDQGGGTDLAGGDSPTPLLRPVFSAETSWLRHEMTLRLEREENASWHTLARHVEYGPAAPGGFGPAFGGAEPGRLLEVHGEPTQRVTLLGEAARLGQRPTAPSLASVGGRPAFERRRVEELRRLGDVFGAPAYELRWSIEYDVAGHVAGHDVIT